MEQSRNAFVWSWHGDPYSFIPHPSSLAYNANLGVLQISGFTAYAVARLAQLVERKALNLLVVGSSPTAGAPIDFHFEQSQGLKIKVQC